MKSSEFNEERRRSNLFRSNWVKALLRPETAKALITGGRWLFGFIQLALELVKVFRE
jgi:hypothetical protein